MYGFISAVGSPVFCCLVSVGPWGQLYYGLVFCNYVGAGVPMGGVCENSLL